MVEEEFKLYGVSAEGEADRQNHQHLRTDIQNFNIYVFLKNKHARIVFFTIFLQIKMTENFGDDRQAGPQNVLNERTPTKGSSGTRKVARVDLLKLKHLEVPSVGIHPVEIDLEIVEFPPVEITPMNNTPEEIDQRGVIHRMLRKKTKVDLLKLKNLEVPSVGINPVDGRYRKFMKLMHLYCKKENNDESFEIDDLRKFFAEAEKINPFNDWEFDACIKKMEGENKVMTDQNIVYII